MKGISTVIATLLMLVITLGLVALAYTYITGIFTVQMQGIELLGASCANNNVTITLRNIGTSRIETIRCQQIAPSGDTGEVCNSTAYDIPLVIEPGQSNSIVDPCSGSGVRSCIYILTPPVGRPITVSVTCI